ncbi:DHA2 family efflux MFS transporter permease subunit [Acinetobacter venetianus]|uniref:DHA2 family efflux MFS transporter permease subunit n=1 Tax=Acinetobacter venetianus TaxID=52133 RepID=UPI0003753A76|nr:DHA2 family efflux MFS transporter permease subunit [Acinetobacter venetianus]MDA0694927.1 DHA2 family efflux MFS transporter permease subunit [Pseudomonadota bacterium]MDA1252999.1 DHA2 family efflux MFS transporter permease subunit [Pseudomonadota bacterium]
MEQSSVPTAQSVQVGLQRYVLLTVMLGTGTVSLNNSSFNPAIPQLMQYFQIGEIWASWVVVAFLLAMSISLPLAGYFSQRFGKRQTYLTALLCFALASTIGGLFNQFESVLIARALQGFCSGLMIPLSLGLIFSVTPTKQRGSTTGLWGSMIMLTLAIGPMLGALVLVWLDWQALFFINLPIACIALVLGYLYLPKEQGDMNQSFDWLGFIYLSTSIILLLVTLSQIHQFADLVQPIYWLLLGICVLTFWQFVRRQKVQTRPLIEPALFDVKGFRFSLMICVAQTVGLFIGMLLVPLWIQQSLKLSPLWTGFALMSSALVTGLCSQPAGKYLDKYGASKIMSFGLIITALSFALLAWAPVQNVWFIICCMMLHGLGMGLSYMPSTTAGLNSLRQQQQHLVTQAAALNNLFRRLFAAVAVVLAALYLQLRQDIFQTSSNTALDTFKGIQEIFVFCTVLILCALPYAWRFPDQHKMN